MRVVVTGAGNPTGDAIVRALLKEGHMVRLFGVGADVAARFAGQADWFPGDLATGGSIEPVLSEREALVHAACLDPPGRDRRAHAARLERGTLYARYGAEREQVDHFIHVTPADPGRTFRGSQERAIETAEATRGVIHTKVVRAGPPDQAAAEVVLALDEGGRLGKQPGRETDAVTA